MPKPDKTIADFRPEVLEAFDQYVHGIISRRDFLRRAGAFAAAGVTATALLRALSPRYAGAEEISADDSRIRAEYVIFPSPLHWQGYLCRPAQAGDRLPGVLVIHENRGRNPYIEDVTRRLAVAGFLALAPDALTPFGGWPGNDDEGRALQAKLDPNEMLANWVAAFRYLKSHPACSGKVGAVGFCYGGGVVNQLAVRVPALDAGVAFYGRQPPLDEVPNIHAALLLHYAALDQRITSGAADYEAALRKAGVRFEAYVYGGAAHGFHNNTTPRYQEDAARLAEQRTIDWFNTYLR
jgi:carboxymethylenebutenolidase